MVGDTARAHTGRLGPPHQEPDSLLRTETGVEDDGESLVGAVLGVPGGRSRSHRACRRAWLWSLRWLALASRRHQRVRVDSYHVARFTKLADRSLLRRLLGVPRSPPL